MIDIRAMAEQAAAKYVGAIWHDNGCFEPTDALSAAKIADIADAIERVAKAAVEAEQAEIVALLKIMHADNEKAGNDGGWGEDGVYCSGESRGYELAAEAIKERGGAK